MSDSAVPWMYSCPAPLFMEFSSQEYQSGLPFPSPENLPNPGIEPGQILYQLSPDMGKQKKSRYYAYPEPQPEGFLEVSKFLKKLVMK